MARIKYCGKLSSHRSYNVYGRYMYYPLAPAPPYIFSLAKKKRTAPWERPREYEFPLRNPAQLSAAHRVIFDIAEHWAFDDTKFSSNVVYWAEHQIRHRTRIFFCECSRCVPLLCDQFSHWWNWNLLLWAKWATTSARVRQNGNSTFPPTFNLIKVKVSQQFQLQLTL